MSIFGLFKRVLKLSVATAVVGSLCTPLISSHLPTELEKVYANGKLDVISRNGPTTYYEDSNGYTGLEYDLSKGFADYLGVELVIHEQENIGRVISKVADGQAHFAAAGLTFNPERSESVRFATSYRDVQEVLIYNRRNPKPKSLEDLVGKNILVISDSAHSQRLKNIQAEIPQLQWTESPEAEMIELIEMVHSGKIDYTIVDSHAFEMTEKIYPRADIAIELEGSQSLAWAFPNHIDDSLFEVAQTYLDSVKASGQLDDWVAKYNNDIDLDRGGALTISGKIESRLPKWENHLKEAGEEFNIEWRLLAAISYQESHWNPKARSRTGVRGFMMLTQTTAKEMGVDNRIDAVQSIFGGAKYFKKIFDRIPDRIQGEDRTWMALAAYNVGMGHLEDARVLTEHLGGNADKWDDVRENLPLLAKRKYYRSLKHGYARGWEPVQYVENIQRYYTILTWHDTFKNQNRAFASTRKDPHSDVQPVRFQNDDSLELSQPIL